MAELNRVVVQLHTETVERHLQKVFSFLGVQFAARGFEVVNNVTVVSKNKTAVFVEGVNLQSIIVPVEVGGRDFNP